MRWRFSPSAKLRRVVGLRGTRTARAMGPLVERYRVTESTTWRRWVTPKQARDQPIHRWFLLPHSFTADLVDALVDEWRLDGSDRILDPFVGAGTTVVAAKGCGIPCSGYDLSPLAVLASKTKAATLCRSRLKSAWLALDAVLDVGIQQDSREHYPELVKNALPGRRLEEFENIARCIGGTPCQPEERDFFRLALIALIPRFSYAVANGGWLRWLSQSVGNEPVVDAFKARVEMMLSDLRDNEFINGSWEVGLSDARSLPDGDGTYTAVITSPPYPNRHDYTRVFGVELMFGFLDWERLRELRYQSFHSHPEARPERPAADEYEPPATLEDVISDLKDRRIQSMLRGYFLDMYLCLREIARVCRAGANVAVVVGNARYAGKAIHVDEYTAELGERAGLSCQEIRVIRWRGNSAQQMGRYGRQASRESVVLFKKPSVLQEPGTGA